MPILTTSLYKLARRLVSWHAACTCSRECSDSDTRLPSGSAPSTTAAHITHAQGWPNICMRLCCLPPLGAWLGTELARPAVLHTGLRWLSMKLGRPAVLQTGLRWLSMELAKPAVL